MVVVPEINTAIVARGDSLWKISRRIYGEGLRYTVIYGANQRQIRDPDLIYPGQVFVLPAEQTQGSP
jgi:nucleoid-associated protein YgaU